MKNKKFFFYWTLFSAYCFYNIQSKICAFSEKKQSLELKGMIIPNKVVHLGQDFHDRSAVVQEMKVKEGSFVEKGQLLAILHRANYLQHKRDEYQHLLKSIENEIRKAELQVVYAEKNFQIKSKLFSIKAVAMLQREKYQMK